MFGGTGDLAHRKLLPALYNLAHDGALPERFRLVGVARADHPHEDFREIARESIMRFSRREPDPDVLDGLIADLRYVPGTFDDDAVYAELGRTLDEFDDQAPGKLDRVSTCRRHRDSSRRSPASWRQRDCTAWRTRIRGS
jgi:glucose-6-phosphate 1-dehydrogenase